MKVAVIGTGYVGLVSGTCFSDLGNSVVCIDNNEEKVNCLKAHQVPFYEPGLESCIATNVKAGRLSFTTTLEDGISDAEFVFIAVGTPPKEDGSADLSAVFGVAKSVIAYMKANPNSGKKVLVTKSTVPIGTGRKIMKLVEEAGLNSDRLAVLSNPEFLREGSALNDFFRPDRVVIGSDDQDALDRVAKLYDPLYRNNTPVVKTTLETSELSKYASNAFLATKISFINEMANLCDLMGADVKDIAKIMGMDGRIGQYFLHSGPGYGGSCFPKDTQALVQTAGEFDYDLQIVKAAESVNAYQKQISYGVLKDKFGALSGKKVALLGLAFKPNTDDIRDSPAIPLIEALLKDGAKVSLFDPEAMDNGMAVLGDSIEFSKNSYEAVEKADAVVLMTEWNAFRELDLEKIKSLMVGDVFVDMRNVYDHSDFKAVGFDYYLIGRPH